MSSKGRCTIVAAATALASLLAACADGGGSSGATGTSASDPGATEASGGWIGADGELEWTVADSGADRGADDATDRAPDGSAAEAAVDGSEMAVGGESASGAEEAPVVPEPDMVVDTSLNAGSVDDNTNWEDYLLYRQDFLGRGIAVHDVDVSGRQIISVVDRAGRPVLGAVVEVSADTGDVVARRATYADGRMMFFAPRGAGEQDPSPQLTARVSRGDVTAEALLARESLAHEVVLDVAATAPPVPLDVLFLLDATGSMGDEIEQLKANMISVAERVDALDPRPDVRFAMTVYRDEGDVFVTRTFDFTAAVGDFTAALRDVVADGGGDTPEALDLGLRDALEEPTWRGDDAVKLVFLVADAPPHLGDGLDRSDVDYAAAAAAAADRGVKIHPIASSGLDDQGEYVLRQLAQLTFGRFNFLTYGADGVSPGDSTPHHVDDYSVLSLDDLVVQLVADELAPLSG